MSVSRWLEAGWYSPFVAARKLTVDATKLGEQSDEVRLDEALRVCAPLTVRVLAAVRVLAHPANATVLAIDAAGSTWSQVVGLA